MRTVLKGKRIILRKLKPSDASSIAKYANDKGVYRYTLRIPYPYKLKDAKDFIKITNKEWKKGTKYRFGIVFNKEVIGTISLEDIKQDHKKAELGYWIGRPFWGKGITSEAVHLILDFAFNDLKLNRISAYTFTPNKASQKVLLKNGFKKEGLVRENVQKDGKFYDDYVFGLLKKEYKKK